MCILYSTRAISDLDFIDRNMLPPNAPPSESESRELTELLEDEKRAVAFIEGLRKQHDAGHQRLSYKATMLKETLDSLKILREMGPTLQLDSIPLLDASSKELLRLTAKRDFLEPLFAGAATLLDGFSALSDAIDLLKSTLEISLGQLENFFTGAARELHSTEMLCAQTSSTINSFSSMVSMAQESIALKQSGVLHPLRRLPEELLVEIFDYCADEEAQSWIENPGRVPRSPKVLTRMAGVCSRWRSIAHSHPRLWRRLLAPKSVITPRSDSLDKLSYRTTVTGTDLFCHALQLCQGAKLDLTIPTQFKIPPDIDIKLLELERLNLLNANETWPPIFSSPKHLWLGRRFTNRPLSREIPLSLVSNTSQITSYSISLTFASPVFTVTHLELCGQHATLPINTLLRSLPQLLIFNASGARISNTPGVNPVQPNSYPRLRSFTVDRSGLAFLEQAVVEGLELPSLRFFAIANIDSEQFSTDYPSIYTCMSEQITHLGVLGIGRVEALRTFINTFHRLDVLSLSGTTTEPVLQALYRPPSSDGDNGGFNYLLPKSVQRVMIWNYRGDGEAIYQQLHEMRADAASNGRDVKIIFQKCLNIRPDIRKKCCSSLVVQQTGGTG
jgi:hypothetical protein